MKLIEFPEQTVVIAKDQPEYLPMPAHIASDQQRTTTVCWKLTWMERIILLFTGRLWQQMWTFGRSMQPQLMRVDKPLLDNEGREWFASPSGDMHYFGHMNRELGTMSSVSAIVEREDRRWAYRAEIIHSGGEPFSYNGSCLRLKAAKKTALRQLAVLEKHYSV